MRLRSFIYLLLIVLAVSGQARAGSILDLALADILKFESTETSSTLTKLLTAKENQINCAYTFENAITNNNLTLGSLDSEIDITITDQLPGEQSSLNLNYLKNNSLAKGNYSEASFDLSSQANTIKLNYATKVNKYFDLALGVNQYSNADYDFVANPGYNYGLKFNLRDRLLLGYEVKQDNLGTLARFYYDGDWALYPTFGKSNTGELNCSLLLGERLNIKFKNQTAATSPQDLAAADQGRLEGLGHATEVQAKYSLADQVSLQGIIGQAKSDQGVKFYDDGQKFVYLQADRTSYYSNLDLSWAVNQLNFSLGVMGSVVDIASRGKIFAENIPDILSNLDNVEKAADSNSQILTSGCRFAARAPINQRLSWSGDLQLLATNLEGDTNIWNTWFFGMIKKLDQTYAMPFKKAYYSVAKVGLKYQVDQDFEINYALKQLIPLYVEKAEQADPSENISSSPDSGSTSGGGIHTLSLAYLF
ncbi:MAG: hypothetical protein ABIH69_00715 [bacterium]